LTVDTLPSGSTARYIGRFAPSPTGPLHAGSLVAALASWLDARAHGGRWLVRIEDADTARCIRGADQLILQQLAECGLHPDAPPIWQSRRGEIYQRALDQLIAEHLAYPCTCSRKDIEATLDRLGQPRLRHGELIYPGTCRNASPDPSRPSRATRESGCLWRCRADFYTQNLVLAPVEYAQAAINKIALSVPVRVPAQIIHWSDRRLGTQQQEVQSEVGDFVLKRADGCFAYQLAVVVDDAAQGITDVVRGEDLADNTARQILLQQALSLPTPRYLHTPLVSGPNGEKLSKQNGAQALDSREPLNALNHAARTLGLSEQSGTAADALRVWIADWRRLGW
jgi:glutamyl-Q tRNA(Asp) synthetase